MEIEAVGGRTVQADGSTPITTPHRKPGDDRRRYRCNPPYTCIATLYDGLNALYSIPDTQDVISQYLVRLVGTGVRRSGGVHALLCRCPVV